MPKTLLCHNFLGYFCIQQYAVHPTEGDPSTLEPHPLNYKGGAFPSTELADQSLMLLQEMYVCGNEQNSGILKALFDGITGDEVVVTCDT